MAFVSNGPRVGDVVQLKRDVKVLAGTFLRGSRMRITDVGGFRGPSMIDLDSGEELSEVFDSSSYEKVD